MNVTLKIVECPQCGAPVRQQRQQCEYCQVALKVQTLSYLDHFDQSSVKKYLQHYKSIHTTFPDVPELNMSIGLCHLNLGLYDMARNHFLKVIEVEPDRSEAYYYVSLSIIKKRKPKNLNLREAKQIERFLEIAIRITPTAKFYYLWAILKYEYYYKNGLRVTSPHYDELFAEGHACKKDHSELKSLLDHLTIEDPALLKVVFA
ncbi:zinc ribbon domain-containing protein [Tumebacillus sp. ITR2]|uniref:Zinc ribbon domain-containing protein n=1 Tax=Tumebacillus amylolyticus TaxID=2801339 RepID=A0ABS1JBA4_9BACL|nr:zinc ribbon domain-containing protein [Tumebacillus amylolyticus]MBL0386893.1 zinc ribbon domain-containing protein [Tumebacillus amylolyticus]